MPCDLQTDAPELPARRSRTPWQTRQNPWQTLQNRTADAPGLPTAHVWPGPEHPQARSGRGADRLGRLILVREHLPGFLVVEFLAADQLKVAGRLVVPLGLLAGRLR
jgi:hypothetical protein